MMQNIIVGPVNDIVDHVGNYHHHKSMFLFLVIGIGLLSSLLVPTTIIMITNVQAYSSSDSNSTSSGTGINEMGICIVGAGGPCNGYSNPVK